jgi:hypothetical protein
MIGRAMGPGSIATRQRIYRPFHEAREFIHSLHLKGGTDWSKYCKSGNKPKDIPSAPDRIYKNHWKGWGDWLGSGTVSYRYRKYRPFTEAREFVHTLGLKNEKEWRLYRSKNRPPDIPSHPASVYAKYWKGMGDWLGTGRLADQKRAYKSFEEAKKFVHSLGLRNIEE